MCDREKNKKTQAPEIMVKTCAYCVPNLGATATYIPVIEDSLGFNAARSHTVHYHFTPPITRPVVRISA